MSKSILVPLALALSVSVVYANDPVGGVSKGSGVLGPAQQRTVLSKTDLAITAPGMEAIVLTVDGGPGLIGKKHYHPGDEFIYVTEGSLILDVEGKGKVTLKKGETLHIPSRVAHQAINPSPVAPFKVVTFGIFEKGKPDTTIVSE